MRRLLRIAKYGTLLITGLMVLTVGALLTWRTYRQHANVKAFEIKSERGIDESGYVQIGGINQWIQIRGEDRGNPVLLCVHGGPGGTWTPVTRLFRAWEKEFTVVLWDQRGAGKTLRTTGPAIASTMSIERMAEDGLEVAEYLRTRLQQDKIVLLGHSFGSILGIRMVERRPDLFYAFVGTGQASDLPRSMALAYSRMLELARQHQDARTVRELTTIGPPPFVDSRQVRIFFQCAERYQSSSDTTAMNELRRSLLSPPPHYSLGDEMSRMKGFIAVPPWGLYQEMLDTNLGARGSEFEVPIFFFQGTEDHVTPAALAEAYLESIRAPRKEMVRLETGGHFAVWTMADVLLRELVQRVRPLAVGPRAGGGSGSASP